MFLKTNRFRRYLPQYRNGITIGFDHATSDTAFIIAKAKKLLQRLYQQGYFYHKCGIMLLDLVPEDCQQYHLFVQNNSAKSDNLMKILDDINKVMGPRSLFYAAQGIEHTWQMRCDNR